MGATNTVVLIPAYKPEQVLVSLCEALVQEQVDVVVVNDGSGAGFQAIFAACEPYATVLGYEKNHGKGYAIKHGLSYIRAANRGWTCIVTADADGQHAVQDILKTGEKVREKHGLVLGARALKGNIPAKSRMGNWATRVAYAVACSKYLHDNQTGLRGFPIDDLDWMLYVSGNRYEYELNALLYAGKRNLPIYEVPIETIYIENNRASHFDPVRDTLRLHGKILESSLGSIVAMLLWYCIAILLFYSYRVGVEQLTLRMLLPVVFYVWLPIEPIPFAAELFPYACVALMSICFSATAFVLNTCSSFSTEKRGRRLTVHAFLSALSRVVLTQVLFILLFGLCKLPFFLSLLLAVVIEIVPQYELQKLSAHGRRERG